MPHLSPEKIAALVDEPATEEERGHLEGCARCRADFIAMRRIVAAAGAERERPIAPLVPWQSLSAALREEGVLKDAAPSLSLVPSGTPSGAQTFVSGSPTPASGTPYSVSPTARSAIGSGTLALVTSGTANTVSPMGGPVSPHASPMGGRPAWMRTVGMAAAAALLVTLGVAGGRASALRTPAPAATLDAPATIAAVQKVAPTAIPVAQYRTPEEARATLHSAEEVYSSAMLWLAAHDSALAPRLGGGSEAAALGYRQRLEVLDAAMATARRALSEAPDDPVMNRYYLATFGAREVTLRRLTSVLPASQQVLEY